ncbi:MAG: hypothetical protein AB7G40_18115 [Hyphomonadaceae bacterium]
MSDPREPSGSRAIHQWSGGSGNLPTVIYAPPPGEPSVTRGVTGLFVPIFLGIFIIIAIYFYAGAWRASQRLAEQQAVTRDTAELLTYLEDLERQNVDLCQRLGELPDRVERPNLQTQLETVRREFDAQCRNNERIATRLGGDAALRCTAATPPARSELSMVRTNAGAERRETVSEFRSRICRSYVSGSRP